LNALSPDAALEADEALTGPIMISLREARLVAERILLLSPVLPGLVPGVRDAVLYSEALGLGGFRALLDGYAGLARCPPPGVHERDGALHVDCHGAHAWTVAPGLADLAVEQCFSGGGEFVVTAVAAAEELAIVTGLAARYGVQVSVTTEGPVVIRAASASEQPAASRMDALMWRMVRVGFPVLGTLWWQLYHLSNAALSPDNVVSRRHAGHLVVRADGSIIGRRDVDDDTDLRLLLAP
jgi:hypothetical protein